MRRIKMTIAVVAALSAVAAFAAVSASAKTVLCNEAKTTCPSSLIEPSGTAVVGVINTTEFPKTSFNLIGPSYSIRCTKGAVGAVTTAEAGNPLQATGGAYLYSCANLYNKEEACTASSAEVPVAIYPSGEGKGTLKMGTASKHMSFTYSCPVMKESCTFGVSEVPVKYGFEKTDVYLETGSVSLTREGGTALECGSSALLVFKALWLGGGFPSEAAYTVLCKVNQTPCSEANTLPAGSYLPGVINPAIEGTNFSLKMSGGLTIACSAGLFGAKSLAVEDSPLAAQAEALFLGKNCTVAKQACSYATASQPPASIAGTGSGNGTVTFGTSKEHQSFTVTCNFFGNEFTCTYGSAAAQFNLEAANQLLTAKEQSLALESSSGPGAVLCTSGATLNASAYLAEPRYAISS